MRALSCHDYDAAGRLRQMTYTTPDAVLGHFAYEVDARGNRTAATEVLKSPTPGSTTILSDDAALDYYAGTWSTAGAYMESTNFSAALRLMFLGDQITLTLGQDDDHGICDVYINNVLWGSLDTYAASPGDEVVTIDLDSEGPHVLDLQNRADKNMASSGYRLSFKQLVTNAKYDLHTVMYSYDGLSRLIAADYYAGENVDGDPFREYDFAYDLAGNRTQQIVEIAGSPTTTDYTYDAANRMTAVGAQSITYNNAGQMTDDGTLTYSWDRGGRLLGAGGSSYEYNGFGNRLSQTVSAIVTDYLLDLQPGLSRVLTATTGANVDRFVHTRQGIHAQHDATNGWQWMIQDGLGSVRGVVDSSLDVDESRHYAPYGEQWGVQGSSQTDFGFTGEPTGGNGLVHLRARYLNPVLGVFPSLDPVEGALQEAMSLNRYGYVAGNVINSADPSGESPNCQSSCTQEFFNYNGTQAAQYALQSSFEFYPRSPGDIVTSSAFDYSALGARNVVNRTSSALFISEVLHAGGNLPMTLEEGSDGTTCSRISGRLGGWRTCLGGDATTNWRGHRPLINYLIEFLGATSIGPYTNSDTNIDNAPSNPVAVDPGVVRDANHISRFAKQKLAQVRVGDYMFINSGDYQPPEAVNCTLGVNCPNDDHGYIVVGWGEPVNCYDALVRYDTLPDPSTTIAGELSTTSLSFSTSEDKVPYVVDFSFAGSWKQDPRPRPFYCSRFNSQRYYASPLFDSSSQEQLQTDYSAFGQFGEHKWEFIHIPPRVYIPCDRQYQP